jgi:hypothetical protein
MIVTEANLVIVANGLQPSAFQQIRLVQHGIFSAEAFPPDSIFSPTVVSVPARDVALLVLPDRMQATVAALTGASLDEENARDR